MKNFVSVLSLILLFCFTGRSQEADPRLDGLESDLNAVLDSLKVPGFSVAIVDQNGLVYANGFGYSDIGNKVKASKNTQYAIGSCSKAFTSALLGKLRQEEKVDFEERPAKYISELRFYNETLNEFVKVKDIMCHRTGLPRHDLSWYMFPTDSKDELVKRVEFQEPFTGIREQWYYNNFMFLLQGVITERVTGKSWEENIESTFFGPLGMNSSTTGIEGLSDGEMAAVGYQLNSKDEQEKMDYYDIAAMSPAGSINSSVAEMAHWVRMWINGGKVDTVEILPASYIREATGGQMLSNSGRPGTENPDIHFGTYGYGWMMISYKGHYRVEHGGNIDGFSASTSFFPTDSIGIIVLTNQNGSAATATVRNIIADRMLNVERTDWTADIAGDIREQKANQKKAQEESGSGEVKDTSPNHQLEDYTGIYKNQGYGEAKIYVNDSGDSLFMQAPKMTIWLKHLHYDVFEPYLIRNGKLDSSFVQMRFNFMSGTGGEISSAMLPFEPTLDPIEFSRNPLEVEVESSTLEQYVGKYEIMGTEITVSVKEKKLRVVVPGQPEYELIPTGEHKFAFKDVEGFSVEFEMEDSRASTLTFHQPNGSFKAMRKE